MKSLKRLFDCIRVMGFKSGFKYWNGTAVLGVDYECEGIEV